MTIEHGERPPTVACERLKPIGGYALIPAKAILAAWWAYRAGFVEYRDLRVWLACHEAVARRCGLAKGRVPRYTLDEIRDLVGGVGGEHLRASIARLATTGLLRLSESAIEFGGDDGRFAVGHVDELAEAIAGLENRERRVPVPRRILRRMCQTARPSVTGTMLALLLRCAYVRKGAWSGRGRCSSSWAATTFGLDERSVKSARGLLGHDGIIAREPNDPLWASNRWGAAILLHPEQVKDVPPLDSPARAAKTERSPRESVSTTEPPPPMKTGISVRDGSRDQNSASAPKAPGNDGVRMRTERGTGRANVLKLEPLERDAKAVTAPTPRKPALRHVEPEDLHDPQRLDALWRDAVASGLVQGGEASRLRFFGAAARAIRVAVRDRAAVFAAIVRKGLWANIAQQDEDTARGVAACLPQRESTRASPLRAAAALEPAPTDPAEIRRLIAESMQLTREELETLRLPSFDEHRSGRLAKFEPDGCGSTAGGAAGLEEPRTTGRAQPSLLHRTTTSALDARSGVASGPSEGSSLPRFTA